MGINNSGVQSINEYFANQTPSEELKKQGKNKEGVIVPSCNQHRRELLILKSSIKIKNTSSGDRELIIGNDDPYPFGSKDSYAVVPLINSTIKSCIDAYKKPTIVKHPTLRDRLCAYYNFICVHVRCFLSEHAQWNKPFISGCGTGLLTYALTLYFNKCYGINENPITILVIFMVIGFVLTYFYLLYVDKFENPHFVSLKPYLDPTNVQDESEAINVRPKHKHNVLIAVLKEIIIQRSGITQNVLKAILVEVLSNNQIKPASDRTVDDLFAMANKTFDEDTLFNVANQVNKAIDRENRLK